MHSFLEDYHVHSLRIFSLLFEIYSFQNAQNSIYRLFKGMYYCPIEIIKGLTDKGQFQYLIKLKGAQEGNYLYITQFLSPR